MRLAKGIEDQLFTRMKEEAPLRVNAFYYWVLGSSM
jgi:hypothetical protein